MTGHQPPTNNANRHFAVSNRVSASIPPETRSSNGRSEEFLQLPRVVAGPAEAR